MPRARARSVIATEQDIIRTYLQGIAAVQAVLSDPAATRAQKNTARQSLDDLTIMLGRFSTANIEGRSALLLGLIHELREVTDRIEPESPIAGVLDRLTEIAGTAGQLLQLVRQFQDSRGSPAPR